MAHTKTVSLRVDADDLASVEKAGLSPTAVMRDALHARAAALRAKAWAEAGPRWKLPAGSPPSETVIRQARDRR